MTPTKLRKLKAANVKLSNNSKQLSDDELQLLKEYWCELIELTTGIDCLHIVTMYAASKYTTVSNIICARVTGESVPVTREPAASTSNEDAHAQAVAAALAKLTPHERLLLALE